MQERRKESEMLLAIKETHGCMQTRHFFFVFVAVTVFSCSSAEPYTSVASIGSMLNSFGNHHCLIHITYYPRSQVLFLKDFPLVIRDLNFFTRKHCDVGFHKTLQYCIEWIPVLYEKSQQAKFLANQTFICSSKRYFGYEVKGRRGLCIGLIFSEMVVSSKPWNCELHAHISPPINLFVPPAASGNYIKHKGLLYPPIWIFQKSDMYRYPMPSTIPEYILLVSYQTVSTQLSDEILFVWAKNVVESFLNYEAFHKLDATNIRILYLRAFKSNLVPDSANVIPPTLFELVVCYSCSSRQNHNASLMKLEIKMENQIHFVNERVISRQSSSRTTSLKISQLDFLSGVEERYMLTGFKYCPVKRLQKLYGGVKDFPVLFLVDLWLTILGNHSYTVYEDGFGVKSCRNGKRQPQFGETDYILDLTVFTDNAIEQVGDPYPMVLSDSQFGMHFVTCGSAELALPVFEELLSSFDKYTWLLILLSVSSFFLMSLANLPCYSIKHALENLLDIFAILVEKPSFTITKFKETHPATAIIFCAAMGVVISNGYRNTNVYKMAQPRIRHPLDYLSQLIERNYNIYSPALQISVNNTYNLVHPNHLIELSNYSNGVYFYSDIYIRSELSNIRHGNHSKLLEHSKIYPEGRALFDDFLHTYSDVGVVTWYHHLKQQFLESQEEKMWKELCGCNKTAFILPQYKCAAALVAVEKACPGNLPVTVGINPLSNSLLIFTLTGILPPHIIRHLKLSKESGVLEWITSVMEIYFDFSLSEKPTATKLQGNVIVIFTLFLAGVLLSIVTLVLEIIMKVGSLCFNKINYWCSRIISRFKFSGF